MRVDRLPGHTGGRGDLLDAGARVDRELPRGGGEDR
jgi:hypothetical protein